MGKRSPTVTYLCESCSKKCTAMDGALLAMLRLCGGCQEKRYADGLKEQRKAEAANAG